MAEGWAVRDQCHTVKGEAIHAWAAHAYPRVHQVGACTYVQSASLVPGGLSVTSDAGGPLCPAVAPLTYSEPELVPCDPLTWSSGSLALSVVDGALVSGAIVTLWLAAWGWRTLYRLLRSPLETD